MMEYEMASLAVQHDMTSLGYVQAWIALGVGVMQCGLIGWGVFVMQGSTASRDATLLALQNQGEALKNQGEALRDQREAFQNQGEVLKDQGPCPARQQLLHAEAGTLPRLWRVAVRFP